MDTMKPTVSKLEWLSVPAAEAVLTVTDGTINIQAFSQPCRLREGDEVKEPLLAFDTQSVVLTAGAPPSARLVEAPFRHECCGIIVDTGARLIRVGEIPITLDIPLPGDVSDGQVVCFTCARVDCLE